MSSKITNQELFTKFPKNENKNVFIIHSEPHKSGKTMTYYLGQYTDSPISYSGLANNSQSTSKSYKDTKNVSIVSTSQEVNSRKPADNIIRSVISIALDKVDQFTEKLTNSSEEIVDIHGYCHANLQERPYYLNSEGSIVILQKKLHSNPTNKKIMCVVDEDGRWLLTKNQYLVEKKKGYCNTAVTDFEAYKKGEITFTWIEESELEEQVQFEHNYHVDMCNNDTETIGLINQEESVTPF